MSAQTPHIRYEVADHVALLTIDRPEKRNAMTFEMVQAFFDRIGEAGADSDVRALIIAGAPGSYCAGTDLGAVSHSQNEQDDGALERRLEAEREIQWAIVTCPKPTIAAVDGAAVGMGAEFTCQCDVRIATPRARFSWNFVQRGLVPDRGAASWLLPRQIGMSAALRLLYSAEFLSAEEALELGYIAQLVEPEALIGVARAMAAKFASGSPLAVRMTKQLIYQGLGSDWEAHLARNHEAMRVCINSDDHREGVAAFIEKREPRFSGR